MDSQSIAPGIATAPRAAMPHALNVRVPHVPTPVRPAAEEAHLGSMIAAGETTAKEITTKPPTAEEQKLAEMEKKAGRLSNAGQLIGIGFILEGIGQIGTQMLKVQNWPVIRNMPRFKTAVAMPFVAGPRAMRDTQVKDLFQLRANHLENVAAIAEKNGATKMAQSATAKAAASAAKGAAREAWLVEKFKPVRSWGGNLLDKMSGGKVEDVLKQGAGKRLNAVSTKHSASLKDAYAASEGKLPGFMEKAKSFFTRKAATVTGDTVPSELAGYVSRLKYAETELRGAAKADHLAETARTLHQAVHGNTLVDEVAKTRGMTMLTQVEKAASSAGAMHSYEQAASGSMRNVGKALFSAMGRAPVFGTLVGIGAVAGISAHMITHRVTAAKRTALTNDLAKAAGGEQSAYMQNVRGASNEQGRTDAMRTGFHIANEASNVAFATMPGAGGMGLFAGQMGMMMGEQTLSDNKIIQAYAALKQMEEGKLNLSQEDQIMHMRYLLTAVPALADPKRGGIYNKEVRPAAKALIEKYAKVDDRIAVMADPVKFDAFLKEEKAKQAEKAEAAVVNDNESGQVNAKPDISPKAAAEAAYAKAERPQMAVVHGKAAPEGTEHHGRVVNTQLQRA